MIVDYWIVRRRQLDLAELYKMNGSYSYSNGWNWRAIVAVLVSVVLVLPGFVKAATTAGLNGGPFPNPTFIENLYNYGLFLTFTVSALVYLGLSMIGGRAAEPVREPEAT
jgi:NCS1 family nucleobase:cation symporter-1